MTLKTEGSKIDVIRFYIYPFYPHSNGQVWRNPFFVAPLKRKVQNQLSGLVPTSEPSCSSKQLAYVVTCAGFSLNLMLFPTTKKAIWGVHPPFSNTPISFNVQIQSITKLQSVLSDIHRVFYLQKQKSDKLAGCKTPGRSKKRWDSDSQHFSNPLTFSNSQSYRAVIVDKSSCCDHGGSGSDQIDPRLSLMALMVISVVCV